MGSMCQRCSGTKHLVWGALLLLNAFVWPQWVGVDGWVSFFAVLFVLQGFLHLVLPNKCKMCNACVEVPAKGKKK
ncbi:MAG TPA: hypothetical protein VJI15_01225 [Candidatus Nanoarchaeia archaeon]|nr:hypothetical protein [Candidatus Nanoarchaeia archaeon]